MIVISAGLGWLCIAVILTKVYSKKVAVFELHYKFWIPLKNRRPWKWLRYDEWTMIVRNENNSESTKAAFFRSKLLSTEHCTNYNNSTSSDCTVNSIGATLAKSQFNIDARFLEHRQFKGWDFFRQNPFFWMLLLRLLLVSKSFEPNSHLLLGQWFANNIQIPRWFMVLTPLIGLSTSHPRRCGMLFPCFDNVIILGPKRCSILSSIHKIRHLYPNTRSSRWGFMLTGGGSPCQTSGTHGGAYH